MLRCGPCKQIAPFVDELAAKYPNAHFINVDVDECQETAAAYGISAMPSFVFLRNKTRLALLRGADKAGLEEKITQFYTDASQDQEVGVKGMVCKIILFGFSSRAVKKIKIYFQYTRCRKTRDPCKKLVVLPKL